MDLRLRSLRFAAFCVVAMVQASACRGVSSPASGAQPEPRGSAPLEAPPATAPAPSAEPQQRTPSKLAQGAEEALACRSDADCTITCRSDGSCCLEQCGCSQPMSRAFLQKLEAHLTKECGPNPLCPMAGCVGEKKYAAQCQNGQCVANKLPGSV